MNSTTVPRCDHPGATRVADHASLLQRLGRRGVLRQLGAITEGSIEVVEREESWRFGDGAPRARITVQDPAFWTAAALGGTCGAGAAYMRGAWDCDDLTALVRVLCRNRDALDRLERTAGILAQPLRAALHRLKRNSIEGAARNIHAHYDLGDALFRHMLDDSMMYSSAIFPHPAATLHEAQTHKNELLCRALDLRADDHLLEIGTGWGGFAVHAAQRSGCRVTTTTISADQYRIARERVAAAGLADRVCVLHRDYRELTGCYDKLVSIEMIEAVGHEYYPTFFRTCDRLLAEDGIAVLQAITIADHAYDRARRTVDFIKRYIFPGSCIPSVSALAAAAGNHSRLRPIAGQDYGAHYARTLAAWRDHCHRHADVLAAAGYDAAFRRLWDFYLCYCEGGFAEGDISVHHLSYAKPGWRSGAHRAFGYL